MCIIILLVRVTPGVPAILVGRGMAGLRIIVYNLAILTTDAVIPTLAEEASH